MTLKAWSIMAPISKYLLASACIFSISLLGAFAGNALYNSTNKEKDPQMISASSRAPAAVDMNASTTTPVIANAKLKAKDEIENNLGSTRRLLGQIIKSDGTPEEIEAATRAVVNSQIKASSDSYRRLAKQIADNEGGDKAASIMTDEALPGSRETAALPRNSSVTDNDRIFRLVQNSAWIEAGSGPKILYVFYDLRCPACLEVHKYLRTHIDSGAVTVRYIPVGALGPKSLHLAALAMAGDDNPERLHRMGQLMEPAPDDAIPYQDTPKERLRITQEHAQRNFAILLQTKRPATPTFVYESNEGPQVSVISGNQSLLKLIRSIKASE